MFTYNHVAITHNNGRFESKAKFGSFPVSKNKTNGYKIFIKLLLTTLCNMWCV